MLVLLVHCTLFVILFNENNTSKKNLQSSFNLFFV